MILILIHTEAKQFNIKEIIIETEIINLLKILKTKVNRNFKLNIKYKYELIPNKSKIEHY